MKKTPLLPNQEFCRGWRGYISYNLGRRLEQKEKGKKNLLRNISTKLPTKKRRQLCRSQPIPHISSRIFPMNNRIKKVLLFSSSIFPRKISTQICYRGEFGTKVTVTKGGGFAFEDFEPFFVLPCLESVTFC